LLILFCFLSCKNEKAQTTTLTLGEGALIEVAQLLEHTTSPELKIIDFRKKEIYQKGHLPNAIQLWRSDIEDASFAYKGMMASKVQLEKLLSAHGIASDDTLVVYDDNGSCDAARLWWVLKSYGFNRVKILNGGIKAWETANASITKALPAFNKTVFKLPEARHIKLHIGKEAFKKLLLDSLPDIIIDTRTTDEYSGKRLKKGAAKAGRIPNSTLIDWAQSVDFEGTQKFKSMNELKALFGDLNSSKDTPIVAYCHSGVRSAHTTFVLTELLGYKHVKNYDGSWTEWSHFDDLEKDSITVILQ